MLTDILLNSIMITGLVCIMMMLIESIDLESKGHFFRGLRNSRISQIGVAALLGSIPGCIGGFAAVSLYSQRLIGFGALVAMMVASTGDEAFMLIAMEPQKALWIFLLLFAIAIAAGLLIEFAGIRRPRSDKDGEILPDSCCHRSNGHELHTHGHECHSGDNGMSNQDKDRTFVWKRTILLTGVLLFLAALLTGLFGHDHGTVSEAVHQHGVHEAGLGEGLLDLHLLDETWMNVLFACLSLILVAIIWKGSDHLVEHQLWDHIILRHLPTIFGWTFGIMAVIGILMHYIDISSWISDNTALMIILAALIGLIPESGPHMLFITLYSAGIVPLSVLLSSCISQDGHSSLPLLAQDKKSFVYAKLLNCLIALCVGFGTMFLS